MTASSSDPFEQSDWDDQSLSGCLEAARDGDADARNRLLKNLKKYLDFVACHQLDRSLQDKVGPSDIVQQSMLHAVNHLEQFRGGTLNEFRGWLRQIVINEAKQTGRHLRAQKRDVARELRFTEPGNSAIRRDLQDHLPTPGTRAVQQERTREVQRALEGLSEVDRMIIQWRNWENLSFEQIAERLGVSVSSASRKWYAALIAFKEQLGQ